MSLKQPFAQAPAVKILINIGSLLDIPTGTYLKGSKRENILLGGLGTLTGVTGIANSYKSTIMHYMMLSAANRLSYTTETSMSTYDTEINIHESRLKAFADRFECFADHDIINDGTWVITDKTMYYGNKWYEELKKFMAYKMANASKIQCTLPFFGRDHKTPLTIITPTFSEVDSFSHFETEDVAKIQNENELGDSGGNMLHARQGLAKTRLLMELPNLAGASNQFTLLSAHMGKEIQLASGPFAPAPTKKLQHMAMGDKIKGVTDQFFFLMSNCWQTIRCSLLINQTTKGPEYPRDPSDNTSGDTDLNIVTLKLLRSKSGPSGTTIDLVVSQSEGVLPSLTEFHYIKGMDRFGISGSLHNYSLDLLPDVKVSRTTIRSKIDENKILRRAINITAELCQIKATFRHLHDVLVTPKELYDDLIAQGYDMNIILATRGWWTVNNDKHPELYLSTLDLVMMHSKNKDRHDAYFPYWMNPDKTINPNYVTS